MAETIYSSTLGRSLEETVNMSNHRNDKSSSTISIRLMCAIVFVVFSFCWLYYFQADVLMMSQHVLSKGLTHYNPLVGAVLITLLLGVIQYVVYGVIHLTKRFHALTYLPSMLILGMLSSVNPIGADGIEVGFSWYTPILVIVCWWMLTRMGRLAQEVEYDKAFELFSQPMWINMLIMAFLMICVAWIGNSNAVLHYRMKVERCLLEGNIDGALKVGKKSLESDADLTMLRMYALARKGTMGESLFEYPVDANSSQMLPTDSLSTLMMYPVDSLYRFLGARPASRKKTHSLDSHPVVLQHSFSLITGKPRVDHRHTEFHVFLHCPKQTNRFGVFLKTLSSKDIITCFILKSQIILDQTVVFNLQIKHMVVTGIRH